MTITLNDIFGTLTYEEGDDANGRTKKYFVYLEFVPSNISMPGESVSVIKIPLQLFRDLAGLVSHNG